MGAEYQAKVADVQSRSDKMTQTEKEMAVLKRRTNWRDGSHCRDKAQEDLAKQEEELLAPMVKRTNDAIKAVADENNFTYILDTSTGFVLYYDKGIDIMPLVKTKLGSTDRHAVRPPSHRRLRFRYRWPHGTECDPTGAPLGAPVLFRGYSAHAVWTAYPGRGAHLQRGDHTGLPRDGLPR